MTLAQLEALFERLQAELAPLAQCGAGRAAAASRDVLAREFPLERQPVLARQVAAALGFDLERGRLDVGPHPFCTSIGPGDVRIALRYHAHDFARGFFALLHEIGHALYDQGLDPAHYGTPMGEAASLGLHESQSRLWENLVGRSQGFWRHFYPQLRGAFPEPLHDISMEEFRRAMNRVVPGAIRVEADEVTYDLHIVIRFELERALLAGDLRAADLPGAWAERYRDYLGVTPKNDRTGCLQDGHWSEGLIGYFPTYTLGNVYAAQLFAAAERAVGPLTRRSRRGFSHAPRLAGRARVPAWAALHRCCDRGARDGERTRSVRADREPRAPLSPGGVRRKVSGVRCQVSGTNEAHLLH